MTIASIDLNNKTSRKIISSSLKFTKKSKLLDQHVFDLKISMMISHMEKLMSEFDNAFKKDF